jgi:hypothetical protein
MALTPYTCAMPFMILVSIGRTTLLFRVCHAFDPSALVRKLSWIGVTSSESQAEQNTKACER